MSLPNSWVMTPLSNLLDRIVGGGTPSKSIAANFIGKVPFMTVKDMKARFITDTVDHISEDAVSSSATTKIPADTLVVATRMSLGKIVRPSSEVAINQDLKALFPFAGVNKTYIEYFWRSKSDFIQSIGTGTTVKGIRIEDIKNLEVPLAPEIEQRRIADKVDTVLTRVDALNDRLARITPLLKRFRQSVLAAATSGRLTEDWRGGAPNWNEERLGKLAKFIDYRGKTPQKTATGVPLITAKNVKPGYLNEEPREFIADEDYDSWMTRGFPKAGDVLLTTEAPLGNVVLIDWKYKFALAQRLICLSFDERIIGAYAAIAIQSQEFQKKLIEQSSGSTVAGIKASRLKELILSTPSINEQTEIVRRVETLFAFAGRLESRLQSAQTAAERLTPALLAKAFRGELVPQDPNDEPAAELLRRLCEARAAQAPTKPKRERNATTLNKR